MTKLSRAIVLFASLILLITFFVPLWKIELTAPQYPEGLVMEIWTHKLGGDVDVINGLNHYIGMATMHTEDFIEFKVLPYIIGVLMLIGIAAAVIGKRWSANLFAGSIVVFGIVAMVDFYIWEYDYGHNLDPNAPIQVPGMSYQPPLIGYKVLLNFGAYSIPDTGGWVFVASALMAIGVAVYEWKRSRQKKSSGINPAIPSLAAISMLLISACSIEPRPIDIGKDQCAFCKMIIMDQKFGSEILLKTGKPIMFDDLICGVNFLSKEYIDPSKVHQFYVMDYQSGELLEAENAFLLSSTDLRSPMRGNIAAFADMENLSVIQKGIGGDLITWDNAKHILSERDMLSGL